MAASFVAIRPRRLIPFRGAFVIRTTGAMLCAAALFAAIFMAAATPAQTPTGTSNQTSAQTPVQTSAQPLDVTKEGGFPPLERWRAAVLAGDVTALKGLYISAPQAFAITPQGKTSDLANEESDYWSKLRSSGLTAINPKILEKSEPRQGFEQLVLRIELTLTAKTGTEHLVISGAQIWAQTGPDDWGILIAERSATFPAPEMRLPEPAKPNTNLYPEPEVAAGEVSEALSLAKKDHKRVLVVFGANWCYDCHVLDEAFHAPKTAELIAANYHVVHVNIGDGKGNEDLAARFEVPLTKGIPGLAVVGSDGQVITSQKEGEFESAAKIGMNDVTQFLERWKPPAAK